MNDSTSLLELTNIQKQYPMPTEPLVVLRDINFSLQPNEIVGVVGPSGSGKSTLLNLIGTLDTPSAGKILFEQNDITQYTEQESATFRNQNIGFIFQEHHLLPQCSVLENVLVPTIPAKINLFDSMARAKELIDRVGLSNRINHKPGQLSGGERQRVSYIRALINKPKLILADEPTGALDQQNAENLMNILIEINRDRGLACVIVTHALDLVKQLDRVFEMRDGTLAEMTTVS